MAVGSARTLAEVYRHFGETEVGDTSPLYRAVAIAISESEEALRAVEMAPIAKRHPTLILASMHFLALGGHAPSLAEAYASGDPSEASTEAVATLIDHAEAVAAIAADRQTQTNETGRCAVLYPAIAEAASRVGASEIGLVDVGCSAGLNLHVDRVGITYDDGTRLGDAASPLQLTSSVVGERTVPARTIPSVVARVGVDLAPGDVSNDDDVRWLRACLWPDQPERVARLDAAIALARQQPATILQGDAVAILAEAIAEVPGDALPVVTTTWAIAYFSHENRLRFLRRLDEAAGARPIAWVSAEGVGIAPAVPTLGDQRGAAHSLVGLVVSERERLRADTIGRCHPHGSWLEWLA